MSTEDTEQYRQFIERLQKEEHRPAALNDIKNLLAYKPAGEAITTIRDVGISKIVQCLNVPNTSHVDLTCEVLRICFEKFQPGDVVKNYTSHIMYLLRHGNSCVRRLAIDQVQKAVTTSPTTLPVPQYIDVYVAVAQLVSDPDISVANSAVLITSNLPHEAYSKVLEEMRIALEYNSSSKCNVFEVVVHISTKSYELFKLCADLKYVDFMISELQTDDVLYQVNILELLSRLIIKPHGINYLVKNGALQSILGHVTELQNNPLRGLLIPGYMKFFGCIAHSYPKEIFEKHSAVFDTLFEAIESGDQTVLPVALDTLGFIGTTVEGKLCLAALGIRYTQAVDHVSQLIRNSDTETKIRALHCFAGLMSIDKDPSVSKNTPVDHRVTLMTREWFRTLDPKPMETLFEICKNPFPDIRQAAFILLDAVCQHQWGEEMVARAAGFIEFLLDRSIVYTKETNEAKYDIIKRLANSPAFDSTIIGRLHTYVEQGPFYSESQLEVAMEEGD
ncbi:26S proteasome non-ATPase regulatory subunit 5 [Helicoverpa armigera]|uniref:26S proteasome non-ATPase regulatory subunit 5 n=1 Tax=Helicoverpa armigera TaxID=29058 RepID=UPI003082D979